MNWRRGLFRLWIVGAALFVLAIAFISYGEIKRQFDAIAAKHLHELHQQHLWHRRQTTATALNVELVGIGPMCERRHVASMSKFLAQISEPRKVAAALVQKMHLDQGTL